MLNKEKKSKKTRSSKEEKLYNNLLKITEQFMTGKGFASLTAEELMKKLSLPEIHQAVFKEVLDSLVKNKVVELFQGKYRVLRSKDEVVKGILNVHPRGFGFLQPEDAKRYSEDIFIPKHLTQNAVDGDTVEVLINPNAISDKGPEGKVISILARGRTHLAGTIRQIYRNGDMLAFSPLLGVNQKVLVKATKEFDLKVGDRIVMEVIDWGSKETETDCKASHYIGHISDPSCDIKAAIEEFELRSDFASAMIQEATKLGTRVSAKEIENREDLREIECFTIDPDTAKDFDDAVSLIKDQKGIYHLGVHIADVSHYVRPGTALDREASERCNSTYFPGTCIPMLPPELSNNLCSLKPNVNRLTLSVFIDIDSTGEVKNYRLARTVIKSAKRFTYKEAKLVLDGKKASKHAPTLHLMVELCGLLKKKRYERGSIEFALPELAIIVDEKGVPTKTDYITYDITHQLIEEFMLKANEIVATHLTHIDKELPYRVHDIPADEDMMDFSLLARAFGHRLSDKPTTKELQKLFDEAMGTPYGEYLATSYIRRMRLAVYSPDNLGHYGLSLTHYTHFTSPIRRYIDLIVHRILFGEEVDRETLEEITDNCSEQERISARAEGNVRLLKKLRLLEKIHQENPQKQYEAIVTRVKPFGLTFEVLELMLEGFFHISELGDDYYVYHEAQMQLRGQHSGQRFVSGDKITVMLKQVDLITLESQWRMVYHEANPNSTLPKITKLKKNPPRKPFMPHKMARKKLGRRKGKR
jgi:ribonuclease R